MDIRCAICKELIKRGEELRYTGGYPDLFSHRACFGEQREKDIVWNMGSEGSRGVSLTPVGTHETNPFTDNPQPKQTGEQHTRMLLARINDMEAETAKMVGWNNRIVDENERLTAVNADMLEALKAFVEAWEKSLQLEKTDVALRLARIAIEKAEQSQ